LRIGVGEHGLAADRALALDRQHRPAARQIDLGAAAEADEADMLAGDNLLLLAQDRDDAARDEAGDLRDADIAVVQIAGLIARRIVCRLVEGQEVAAGERFGLIRFGSRAEVYLPPEWPPLVIPGQRVIGGETVIADASAREAPRTGTAH